MKWIGWLMAACIMMALLKLAVTAMAIALAVLLVWDAINRPRETLMLVGVLVLVAWPHLLLVLAIVGLTTCLIGKSIERL